jgi:hypothetical protein
MNYEQKSYFAIAGVLLVGTTKGLGVYRINDTMDLPTWVKEWSVKSVENSPFETIYWEIHVAHTEFRSHCTPRYLQRYRSSRLHLLYASTGDFLGDCHLTLSFSRQSHSYPSIRLLPKKESSGYGTLDLLLR